MYQLITQVIGRVKRGHQDGKIFIQTFQPDHDIIRFATSDNYQDFYNYLLSKRHAAKLPPYTFLLKLSLTYKTEQATVANAQKLFRELTKNLRDRALEQVTITPPMPAFHERSAAGYTWQVIVKAKSRKNITELFNSLQPNPHLHYDFDPYTLL